jgi:hypothetical protein
MTPEADRLLAVALRKVDLDDGFSPAVLGAKAGLSKLQAETAARALANAGVLVLGFDQSAEFSEDFRRMKAPPAALPPAKKRRPAKVR